jgi:protein tyrosine/serine phosphatase
MTRRLALESIHNFRDFGGYAAGPRRLKRGHLYRSASHSRATEADLEAVAALGLTTIVDLRRPEERQREPSRRWANFAAAVIANDSDEEKMVEPWPQFLARSDLSAAALHGFYHHYYSHAPFEPRMIDIFSRYFRALGEADGPILVHCAAGKDRTGMICALTHTLLGVHEDDIVEDFLLTNEAQTIERRLPLVRQYMSEAVGRTPPEEAVRISMSVAADYLHAAFAAIRDRRGSTEAYLRDDLGVDHALRAAIEGRVLA